MPEFTVENMRGGYRTLCHWVAYEGKHVAPRGQATREILNAMIHVRNPKDALPLGINRRGYSTRFAAVEAAQLIGGVSNVPLTLRINPRMEQFLDESLAHEGKHFHGAYGPRIRYGLHQAVERLKEDPDTRQAVVSIFETIKDLDRRWKDVPCTLNLHFMVRDGYLLLTTHMRSNDVWWGLAYDVFQFTQLQLTVANALGLPAGEYTHVADSLHVYERDLEHVAALQEPNSSPPNPLLPIGFNGDTLGESQRRARLVLINNLQNPSASERWYLQRLHDA